MSTVYFDEITGNLMLYFDEGLISEIRIEGYYKEKTLISRELVTHEGDFFRYENAKEELNKLTSSGFFENISMQIIREQNKNILIVNVREKPSGIIRVGFVADETYNGQVDPTE